MPLLWSTGFVSEGLPHIFTTVSHFISEENGYSFLNTLFVVDSATLWIGTSCIFPAGRRHLCLLCVFFPVCGSLRLEKRVGIFPLMLAGRVIREMRSFAKFPCSVSLAVPSGVGPFDVEHLVFPWEGDAP